MSEEHRLWAIAAATGLHVLEEHNMDWRDWARETLGIDLPWSDFYVTNSALALAAVSGAAAGWRSPTLALSVPAVCAINAVGFHILPAIRTRRYSPGLITAVGLYLPLAAWAYDGARRDGKLSARTAVGSVAAGAAMMAFPFLLGKAKRGGRTT